MTLFRLSALTRGNTAFKIKMSFFIVVSFIYQVKSKFCDKICPVPDLFFTVSKERCIPSLKISVSGRNETIVPVSSTLPSVLTGERAIPRLYSCWYAFPVPADLHFCPKRKSIDYRCADTIRVLRRLYMLCLRIFRRHEAWSSEFKGSDAIFCIFIDRNSPSVVSLQ